MKMYVRESRVSPIVSCLAHICGCTLLFSLQLPPWIVKVEVQRSKANFFDRERYYE